jgi:hypothetical protein
MLQVARLAPGVLGDAAELVRGFLMRQLVNGAGLDRDGRADLYYTIFALAGFQALQMDVPADEVARYLTALGMEVVTAAARGGELDFVHLGALARCWAAIGLERMPPGVADSILSRLERFRSADGGYDSEPAAAHGNAYGCFVALGSYQDLGRAIPEPLRMVQCLKFLETPDGAWANARGLKRGSTECHGSGGHAAPSARAADSSARRRVAARAGASGGRLPRHAWRADAGSALHRDNPARARLPASAAPRADARALSGFHRHALGCRRRLPWPLGGRSPRRGIHLSTASSRSATWGI